MAMDTSMVKEKHVEHTDQLIERHGRRLGLWLADQELGLPKGTMASYFGQLGAAKKKRIKQQRVIPNVPPLIDGLPPPRDWMTEWESRQP